MDADVRLAGDFLVTLNLGTDKGVEVRRIQRRRIEAELSPTLRLPVVAASELLGYSWGSIVRQVRLHLRLAELDVRELASTFTVGVIYRKDAYLSPVAKRFIEALKSAARDMGEK